MYTVKDKLMKISDEVKAISDAIIRLAKERKKKEKFQNINSAIVAVDLEVSLSLIEFMENEK